MGIDGKSTSVLVIEDSNPFRLFLRESLKGAGYEVTEARDGEEGLELYRNTPTDMVITDLVMPKIGGQEVILELAWTSPPPKIVAITGETGDPAFLQVATKFGACRTLMKPFSRAHLVQLVEGVFAEQRKYPRCDVEIPVYFSGQGKKGEGRLINLSMGGCAIESRVSVKSGSYLSLRLNLPDRKASVGVQLAPVRWSTGDAFGLEFIRMKDEAQAVLRGFLHTLCGWPTPAMQPI